MTLEELRNEIDTLDEQILQLLNRRALCAIEVGKIKREKNEEIHVPEREQEIIERLCNLNEGGALSNEVVKHLFQEIFKPMKALQTAEKT